MDEPRLHSALRGVYADLTEDEKRRNGVGRDLLFVSRRNPIYAKLRDLYEKGQANLKLTDGEAADVDCKDIHGIQGTLCPDADCNPDDTFLPAPGDFAEDIHANFAISVIFDLPEFPKEFIFPAKTLPGAKFPEPNLKPKYFGERANAAPRDWSRNNHRSGGQHFRP